MQEQMPDRFKDTGVTVRVYAYQCPEKPEKFAGQPIGQYHCPCCGCMVVAALAHPPCFKGYCVAADEGWHPGEKVTLDIDTGHLTMLREMFGCEIEEVPVDGA